VVRTDHILHVARPAEAEKVFSANASSTLPEIDFKIIDEQSKLSRQSTTAKMSLVPGDKANFQFIVGRITGFAGREC
jgi:hypothetical protein